MSKSVSRAKAGARMVALAKQEIRHLVRSIHNEVHYLRWCEDEQGEAALAELHAEFVKMARDVSESGAEIDGMAGGILEQLDTLAVAAKLTGPKS